MIMLLPAIGEGGIPARVRLVLALAVTVALTPTVQHAYPQAAPTGEMQLFLWVAQEATAGSDRRHVAHHHGRAEHGRVPIATQTGLAYAQTVDPTQHEQGAVMGNFLSMLGAVLIFLTDMHHLAIGAISGSYKMIPPGAALPTGDMAELTIRRPRPRSSWASSWRRRSWCSALRCMRHSASWRG